MKRWILSLVGVGVLITAVPTHAKETSIYTVPAPEALKPFATFEMPEAKLRIENGLAKMEYALPSAFTGADYIKVEAEGPVSDTAKPFELKGYYGNMECVVVEKEAICHIVYDPASLPVLTVEGKEKVATHLRNTIADPLELSNRLEVLEIFFHEAAGTCRNVSVRRRY